MSNHLETKALLEKKLDGLFQRRDKISRDLRQAAEPDTAEQATGRENDEVLEYLDHAGLEEIRQIQKALARIETATYGRCTACGVSIAPERLTALPYTTTCVACAS